MQRKLGRLRHSQRLTPDRWPIEVPGRRSAKTAPGHARKLTSCALKRRDFRGTCVAGCCSSAPHCWWGQLEKFRNYVSQSGRPAPGPGGLRRNGSDGGRGADRRHRLCAGAGPLSGRRRHRVIRRRADHQCPARGDNRIAVNSKSTLSHRTLMELNCCAGAQKGNRMFAPTRRALAATGLAPARWGHERGVPPCAVSLSGRQLARGSSIDFGFSSFQLSHAAIASFAVRQLSTTRRSPWHRQFRLPSQDEAWPDWR